MRVSTAVLIVYRKERSVRTGVDAIVFQRSIFSGREVLPIPNDI